jgi:hypothetical protein
MMPKEAAPPEETLDPQDWDAMRLLGHRMVDDMMDYLQTIRDRPVWQPIPPEVRARFNEPLPLQPQGPAQPYLICRIKSRSLYFLLSQISKRANRPTKIHLD